MKRTLYINKDINASIDVINKYQPKAVEAVLDWADETVRGIITHRAIFEMERCLTPVKFNDDVWNKVPNEIGNKDPEWIYAFARHSILLNLAKAFAYTHNEKYKETFIKILTSFLDHADDKGEFWRSLETGIRPENWIKSIELFELSGSPLDEKLIDRMKLSMKDHETKLVETYRGFHRLSNWGVIQNHGLFVLGIYLDNNKSVELAIERLEEEVELQILSDGVHWEQSPLYHIEVLSSLTDTIRLARKFGIEYPESLDGKTRDAAKALYDMVSSANTIFMQGDSDDIVADMLLFEAAELWPSLGISVEKQEENYFVQGHEVIPFVPRRRESTIHNASNNIYLRGETIEAHFFYGNMGSGHGHVSPLHVDLYANGKPFLIDRGRYTYTDSNERNELKRREAHNTIILDGHSSEIPKGSWGYSSIPLSLKGTTIISDEFGYAEATNLSYLDDKTALKRKVINLGQGIMMIIDDVISSEEHEADVIWNLNSNIDIKKNKLSLDGSDLYMWNNADSVAIEDIYISKKYNEKEASKKLVLKKRTEGTTSIVSIFSTKEFSVRKLEISLIDSKRVLLDSEGIAYEISTEDEKWTVISRAKEIVNQVDITKAGDIEGYGLVLIKKEGWKFPKSIM